jgi:hypothetical protein
MMVFGFTDGPMVDWGPDYIIVSKSVTDPISESYLNIRMRKEDVG